MTSKFIKNRWVKFILNEQVCIGRTFVNDKKDEKNRLFQFVSFLSQKRRNKIIHFSNCNDIKYLEFIAKPDTSEISNKIIAKESIINSIILDKTIVELAKSQIIKSSKN